jgi:hypothetical protein
MHAVGRPERPYRRGDIGDLRLSGRYGRVGQHREAQSSADRQALGERMSTSHNELWFLGQDVDTRN